MKNRETFTNPDTFSLVNRLCGRGRGVPGQHDEDEERHFLMAGNLAVLLGNPPSLGGKSHDQSGPSSLLKKRGSFKSLSLFSKTIVQHCRPANLQNVQIWRPCKKAQKNLEIGTSNLEISKICVNENKNGRFLVSRYSLPYLCYLLYSFAAFFEVSFCFAVDARRQFELTIHSSSFPRDLSTPLLTYGFTGMRSELYPAFPQTLDVTNLAVFNTVFQYCFILSELFGNFKIL